MASLSYPCPSLDATKSQIRLLGIHPQPDESLQYSLRTFDIKSSPPYIALSYTWGDDEPANTIAINGQAFKIRDNLSYALPRLANLRHGVKFEFQRKEAYFWIDAICINQGDMRERNHQVAIMADIFATAALTVAWLGPEDENSTLLTKLNLRHIGPSRPLYNKSSRHVSSDPWNRTSRTKFVLVNKRAQPVSTPRSMAKSFLEKIACKEYFTRMWIIQEILLSKEVWVMCGSGICAWQTLQRYWMSYLAISGPLSINSIQDVISGISNDAAIDPLDAFHSIMGSRFMHHERQAVHLDDLVHLYFDRGCRDPRDRIYALLGLLSPHELQLSPIPVDYNVSLEALFKLARKHFYLNNRTQARDARIPSYENGQVDYGRDKFDYARDLQKALGITPLLRIQCESRMIEEGVFRDV